MSEIYDLQETFPCPICGGMKNKRTEVRHSSFGDVHKTECLDCGGFGVFKSKGFKEFRGYELTEEEVNLLFQKVGIEILAKYRIENEYWDLPSAYCWWLVKIKEGLIKLGWRKRVIEIDWSDTKIEKIVTEDQVTKSKTYVHAWSFDKAVEYLKNWSNLK